MALLYKFRSRLAATFEIRNRIIIIIIERDRKFFVCHFSGVITIVIFY